MKKTTVLVLHNIRSAQNVGAMFRTAEAGGVSKIYLSGYTPTPIDKFNRERKDISKSALGAEKYIAWEYFKTITPILKRLKKDGYFIVGVEQSKDSIDYKKVKPQGKNAILMGNEVEGISKAVLRNCDTVAEIPMAGTKESLNVSVAFGIFLFRFLNL